MILSRCLKGISTTLLVIGLTLPSAGRAQATTAPPPGTHNYATRADLEAQSAAATAAGRIDEAEIIRHRLDQGDFQEGDRIFVAVRGPAGFSDTLTVRPGPQLELPQVAPLPLRGVLRSELLGRLTAHLSQFLREPNVTVRPLLRVGILGDVAHPGYYYASADLPLSDVLMTAGGPAADADLSKLTIQRGGHTFMDARNARAALSSGRSMDMMHMQGGDEIDVGKQRQYNWPIIVSSATAVLGLLIAVSHR